MTQVRVGVAGSDDIVVLARMLTRAAPSRHADGPQTMGGSGFDWVGYFRLFLAVGLTEGAVHTTGDHTAAALWFPRHELYPPPPGCTVDPNTYLTAMRPHFHLAWFGVDPHHRGSGVGGALLAHHHRHLDAQGLPSSVYAWDAPTRDWLRRRGYQPIPVVHSPDNRHPHWPMWREPATPARATFAEPNDKTLAGSLVAATSTAQPRQAGDWP